MFSNANFFNFPYLISLKNGLKDHSTILHCRSNNATKYHIQQYKLLIRISFFAIGDLYSGFYTVVLKIHDAVFLPLPIPDTRYQKQELAISLY